MQLYSPWALLLLLILPLLAYQALRGKRAAAVKFPSLADMRDCSVSWRIRLRPLLAATRLACLGLLIVALARPRKGMELSEVSTEGVAIEAVVDRSGSMAAEMSYKAEKQNRLEVVKEVFTDFVQGDGKDLPGRTGDLIGLITFARYADTVCPLVFSHNVLLEFLKHTDTVRLRSEDGTAIGDAIALAAARLQKAEEEIQHRRVQLGLSSERAAEAGGFRIKSKIMILLTDGRNNVGEYDPLEAAELAKQWGIRIYTIGIGSAEGFTTIQTPLGSYRMPVFQDLDERLLKAIVERTGGLYGRADDAQALRQIVEDIENRLPKTKVTTQYAHYAESFSLWAVPALAILALEMLATCTLFRKVP